MKLLTRLSLLSILTITCAGMASAGAQREQPRYMQALSDLRLAREILNHTNEQHAPEAIGHIQEAIDGIKRATAYDRRDDEHPPIDQNLRGIDLFRKVIVLLQSADRNVRTAEDGPQSDLKRNIRREINISAQIVQRMRDQYRD